MSDGGELAKLARRINWLDRNRRRVAVGVAACIVMPLMAWRLYGWLPSQWPGMHIGAVAVTIAAFSWYGIETLLGIVLAVWETDYARATRPAELPRAEVIERRTPRVLAHLAARWRK